jgi:DUF1707 SHOCT-like domain
MAGTMPGDPRLRVSDVERERTAELLREHHAVGRLTAEEFQSRLDQVFAARTRGELDALLADLPAIDLYQLPSAGINRPARRSGRPGTGLERPADSAWQVAGWVGVGSLSMLIWLGLAVTFGGLAWIPWFLLIVVPWVAALRRRQPRLPPAILPRSSAAGSRSGILK